MNRTQRTVLTIFIGSPKDLPEERREARRVVERLNRHLAKNLNLYIELRGWEDTLPGFSRPQDKINEDVRDSDLFIGMVYRRWGTPTGKYSSGFEEEFEVAKEQRKKGELEDIWLFFKVVPDDALDDPGEQLTKVLSFQEEVNSQREILYDTFDSTQDWSRKLYDYLADYVTQGRSNQEATQTGATLESEPDSAEGGDENELKGDGENDLLTSLNAISEAVLQDKIQEVDRFQSARAYLTSLTLLYINQHATELMGIHENQFLYRHRKQVHLIPAEEGYVLRNLATDHSHAMAGWFWISKTTTEFVNILLAICSIDGLDNVKIGALLLLEHIDADIDFERIGDIIDEADSLVAATALWVYAQHAPLSELENL